MNKKILIVSILAVFMLVVISFASAVSTNTTTSINKKESPLYGIRIRRAIGERLGKIIDYIKTKFIGERIFFLPFQWLRNLLGLSILDTYMPECTMCGDPCVK